MRCELGFLNRNFFLTPHFLVRCFASTTQSRYSKNVKSTGHSTSFDNGRRDGFFGERKNHNPKYVIDKEKPRSSSERNEFSNNSFKENTQRTHVAKLYTNDYQFDRDSRRFHVPDDSFVEEPLKRAFSHKNAAAKRSETTGASAISQYRHKYAHADHAALGAEALPFTSHRTKQFWTAGAKRLVLPPYANRWEDLQLPAHYIKNLCAMGVAEPTEMQMKFVREFFAGKDVFLRCGTGTGKSFIMAVACLAFLHANFDQLSRISCLIVVPTLPLAHQFVEWISRIPGLAKGTAELRRLVQPYVPRDISVIDDCEFEPAIVVGMPSQLVENSFGYSWSDVRVCFIDEADSLIDVPNSAASDKEKRKWRLRPNKCIKFLNYVNSEVWLNHRPTFVAASATLNAPTRSFLQKSCGFDNDTFRLLLSENAPLTARVSHEYLVMNGAPSAAKDPQAFVNYLLFVLQSIYDENADKLGIVFLGAHAGKLSIRDQLRHLAVKTDFVQNALLDAQGLGMRPNALTADWADGLLLTSEAETYGLDLSRLSYVVIIGVPHHEQHYQHLAGRVGRLQGVENTRVITIAEDALSEKRLLGMFKNLELDVIKLCFDDGHDTEQKTGDLAEESGYTADYTSLKILDKFNTTTE